MASQEDDIQQNDLFFEKPPSPILSFKMTRKYLLSKKMQRKSRVKLSDRFSENTSKDSVNLNDTTNSLAGTSFAAPQLEKIEAEEERLGGNKFQKKNQVENFDFKQPESPVALAKPKKTVHVSGQGRGSGFKTAGGLQLNLSDDQIKQSKKLFADILNPGESDCEKSRSNKYAFLSKRRSENFEKHKPSGACVEEQNIASSRKNLVQLSVGFQTASGKGVQISESAYNSACKKFSDESLPKFEQLKDIGDKEEIHMLSTQETNELFSDFTILESGHNTHRMSEYEDSFKGFTPDTINQSQKVSDEFIVAITKLITEIKVHSLLKREKVSNKILKINTEPRCKNSLSAINKSTGGFSMASGKQIFITDSALKSARNKFGEEFARDIYSHFKKPLPKNSSINKHRSCTEKLYLTNLQEHFRGFHDQSIEESKNKAEAIIKFFEEFSDSEVTLVQHYTTQFRLHESRNETLTPISTVGFTTASGNKLIVSETALKKAQDLWNKRDISCSDISFKKITSNVTEITDENAGFQTAAGQSLTMSKDALNKARRIFQSLDNEVSVNNFPENSSSGFQTAAGNVFTLSKDSLNKAKQFFQNIDHDLPLNDFPKKTSKFHTKSETSLTPPEDTSSKLEQLFQNIGTEVCLNSSANSTESTNVSFEDDSQSSKSSILKNSKIHRKKRLGISSCKQIVIPTHKMEQAAKLFDMERTTMSPVRNNQPTIYNSTPLRNVPLSLINSDITPIKTPSCKQVTQEVTCAEDVIDDRILTRECTKGNIDTWSKNLEHEKTILETKLKLIDERQKALNIQKQFTESNNTDHQKRRNGTLYTQKQSTQRISLKEFVQQDTSAKKLLNITPENAELVHFNYKEQPLTYVRTLDGACIVPNINNHIGLSEIETAFKIMPGIEPKLIPTGWIRNHFKWIVWKLASYENFSSNINNCLTVENVIQQLKYRYDREIDRAERSTLRKIFELDDAPQKRMVLCVSKIINLQSDQFELELTDGWYSIRTVIDEPLCRQVRLRKIRVGTKLITCGAEILNCEGCHPLQAADMIRLKISCNSTRRARWYVKLGYQRCPEPFPVMLCSVFPAGNVIGCVKICIARVYPVKYMEKQNNLTVWRNRKAEELRAQEWENKGRQEIEKLRETITKDYEMSLRTSRQNLSLNYSIDQIRNINCPETLFHLYQNNKDPEKFQEILSSSQKNSIVDYQQRILFMQQQDISRKLKDNIDKRQIPKRDVTPVLQMLVIDILDPHEKTCTFHIWRPSNEHVEILKESSVFVAYNVLPKKNGDLCTTSRTRFQACSKEWSNFHKYKRTLFPISQIIKATSKPPFKEFDTIGVVAAVSTEGCSQNLWLADECGRLLFVKVFEGPKNCLLLDNLKIGQVVAASNLVFCESKLEFGEAIANHLTVISCYPKARHLEGGIRALSTQLPKDLKLMLAESQQKISYYISKVNITRDYKNMSSSSLVASNSFFTSDIFDDSSDVLFSMIDVDRVK
ncbi:hypothetical protein Zmor_005625 [Zophobas morio]|uniref:Breast cancer type 2 susceptibility protein-like protein n=1 Tax=Zophobas morio TaxID=2755281 RepID=A0AA38IQ64_9CUCU|nr:hypothetical protein Zmor_005625 [Zophobas morio]